jgi:hypothetical protein
LAEIHFHEGMMDTDTNGTNSGESQAVDERSERERRREERRAARGSLFGGLLLTCVAAAFLLNLNWAIVGPVLIILLGVGLLINALAR